MTARSRPRLVVHEPGGRRVVSIDRPVFRIGRAADADLQLGGADISREHALLLTDSEGYLLRDQSRAGTFVNGDRIGERRLVHGDEIECGRGNAVLMFLTTPPDAGRAAVLHAADLRPLATLLASLRAMGGERVLDEVLAMVLDAAIDASGADRGFILLGDASGRLEMQMARAADQATLTVSDATISRKIPEQVFASGEATVVADLMEGDLATVHTGTVALGIRHVLCVPLRVVRYVERAGAASSLRSIGVLYLDSRARGRLLTDSARQEIEALAGEAAAAIENARLYEQALEKAILQHDPVLDHEVAAPPERSILVAPFDPARFDDLVAIAEPLARRPPRELIVAQLIGSASELAAASALARDRRELLRSKGVAARSAAFTSERPGADLVRIASEQDVDLLLVEAPPTFLDDSAVQAVLLAAPCDVGLLAPRSGGVGPGAILVPFTGAEHDWAAVEIAAWIARSLGASLRLAGPSQTGRDSSRLLARASLAVQRALGVEAEPSLVEAGAAGLLAAVDDTGWRMAAPPGRNNC